MDEKRIEPVTDIEAALRRDAPIDKYLADIENVSRSGNPVTSAGLAINQTQTKPRKQDRVCLVV